MTPVIDITPETQAVMKKSEDLALQLQEFKVTNQDEYNTAGDYLKSVKNATKQLEDLRMSMTRPLDEAKKRIMDLFRKTLDVLTNAENTLKRGILVYQQEQERIRRQQEAKLQAEAEKKRQEALKKAEQARTEGKDVKAEKYEEKAAQTVAPILASNVEKVSGISTKKIWKFEVIDEMSIPREYLIPDLTKIGKIVRAAGETIKIAGIRIYAEETIAAGGR